MRFSPRVLAAPRLAICLHLVAAVSFADVVVVRQDGTRVVADGFSQQTDADRLAVRRERPGIVLTRFVEWNDIASVTVDGRPAAIESLRRSAGSNDAARFDEPMIHAVLPEPVSELVSLQAADAKADRPVRETARADRAFAKGSVDSGFGCVAPGASSMALPEPLWIAPPLPTRGVVVGVWDDPLSAYGDIIGAAYPSGVPVSEAGFALGVLRGARLRQVLGDPIVWPPPPAPGPLAPPLVPRPGMFEEPHHVPPAPAW